MPRPKGARNQQRSPEKMAELRERREKRRALKAAAKTRGNGLGANAQSLTDDQERALHFIHVGEYEQAQAGVKQAMAKRKTAIARIRSEGGNLDQIKASIKLQTPEGEAEVVEEIKRKSQAARWAGVGLQLDLFDQARADATQQYELGKTAGLKGETPRGDVSQDWLTGWHAGQDALSATLSLFRDEKQLAPKSEDEATAHSPMDPEDVPQEEPPDMSELTGGFVLEDLSEGETENLAELPSDENVP